MLPFIQKDTIFASLVRELQQLINEDVIITDEKGIIVASTDAKRINDYHEGAYIAMLDKKKMVMTEQLTKELAGVRKGIVLPIMIESKAVGVLGITGNPDKVEGYARIVQKMAQLFIKDHLDQMAQEKMARNMELFVFDWLHNNLSEQELMERGQFLNLDIQKYSQVIYLSHPITHHLLSYKDIVFLQRQWDYQESALFIRWGQGKILIVDQARERELLQRKIVTFLQKTKAVFIDEVFVGIGQATDYQHLFQSLEQAERAANVARIEKRMVFEEELRLEMIQYALNQQTKTNFLNRTIAPIINDHELLHTLNSYFNHHMSIQQTAQALHIHKNTLYYRLKKIENLTSLRFNRTNELVQLYLANQFLKEKSMRN